MNLMARPLSFCHTIYWNILEDVCLTALHYIGKLAVHGMLFLAFFTVSLAVANSYTSQFITPEREQNF